MADTILRVAGRDYSRYLKLYTEDQVGVVDAERIAPQFAGVAALSEGAVWIADAVSNKHWQVQTIIAGKTDVGLYPGDAWATSQAFWLLAGATYTASTGQVTTPGVGASEGVAIALGTLPAGTYTFRLLLRGNAGGEVVRLSGGLVDGTGGNSASLTLTTAEQPYTMTFTTDGSGTCYAVVRTVGTLAATWFVGNGVVREQAISVDRANQLVAQIQKELAKGAIVEYRPDGASLSTFFDLESGELRPDYNHPRYRKGYVEGVLELFTRPYGNTGTTRLIASAAASMPGILYATGVLGDVDATADVTWRSASAVHIGYYAAAYGVKYPVGSFSPLRLAASLAVSSGGTLTGATWALGSQYLAWNIAPTAGFTQLVADSLPATPEWAGRYRLFAFLRHGFVGPGGAANPSVVYTSFSTTPEPVATTYAVASYQGGAGSGFAMIDLGERTIGPSYQFPKVFIAVTPPGTGTTIPGGLSVALAGLYYLPIDRAAGVVNQRLAVTASVSEALSVEGARSGLAVPLTQPSGVIGDLTAAYRGGLPRVPAIGSPAASGPVGVAYLQGTPEDFFNTAGSGLRAMLSTSVAVRERFSFFR